MKRVFMNVHHCIGCGLCELACLTAHSQSKDLVIAYREERGQGLVSNKKVFQGGAMCASIGCRHCSEPACVEACISGALYKDPESGRTMYDASRCVGCLSCVMACPFGAITKVEGEVGIHKCDRCLTREMPACVEACPNRALLYEER